MIRTNLFVQVALACVTTAYLTHEVSEAFIFLSAVLFHEAGHLITAKLLRVPLLKSTVSPLGIRLIFDFSSTKVTHEILVYLGGSFFGISAACLISYLFPDSIYAAGFCANSVLLGILNLLPITGIDGGCIVECILSSVCLSDRAYRYSRAISSVTVILFWILASRIQLRHRSNLTLNLMATLLIYRELKAEA